MYTPIERSVDRRNALTAASRKVKEMASEMIGGLHTDPATELHRMQRIATQIDARIDEALAADRRMK